jgi:hypothetical protein
MTTTTSAKTNRQVAAIFIKRPITRQFVATFFLQQKYKQANRLQGIACTTRFVGWHGHQFYSIKPPSQQIVSFLWCFISQLLLLSTSNIVVFFVV